MPCYTVREVSVVMERVNHDMLRKAFEAAGYTVDMDNTYSIRGVIKRGYSIKYATYDKQSGSLSAETDSDITTIKKHYAGVNVKANAARFGWKVKQTGEFSYEVTK